MKQSNCTLSTTSCTIDKLNNRLIGRQKPLIDLITENPSVPCFIRAPKKSGAENLIKAYLQVSGNIDDVTEFVVNEEGFLTGVPQTNTVIIQELHWLDDIAAEQFSAEIDQLMESDKRVFVICPVQNDRFENLQSDRLLIDANMLLSDSWLDKEDYGVCVAAFLEDFLPLEIRMLAALTVLLGKTNLKELEQLGYSFNADLPTLLSELNPLFFYQKSDASISIYSVEIAEVVFQISGVLAEYLELEPTATIKPECIECLTRFSIYLLECGNLKRSHQVLAAIETLLTGAVPKGYQKQGYLLMDNLELRRQTATSGSSRSDHDRYPVASATDKPRLFIKLFGEIEIYLNGVEIDNAYLRRNKIRKMLFLMAVNHKMGVSREALVSHLWPYLDFDHAIKNLYTSWSLLGKGLGADNPRDCPFIDRRGQLYKLNFDCVACDTHNFEELANKVLFGNCTLQIIVDSVRQMQDIYKNELISNSSADNLQRSYVSRYRSLIVDSMLVAIKALKRNGDQVQALFFARCAHEIDNSREDVYRELMDVQLESGQRTSAMQTYFSCKRYLSEELGILPSKKTTALYQELLLDRG